MCEDRLSTQAENVTALKTEIRFEAGSGLGHLLRRAIYITKDIALQEFLKCLARKKETVNDTAFSPIQGKLINHKNVKSTERANPGALCALCVEKSLPNALFPARSFALLVRLRGDAKIRLESFPTGGEF